LTQLTAVLFIVQSPYLFTIGHRGVFSLGRWSGQLHTEFHELRATLVRLSTPITLFTYGAFTRYGRPFQTVLLSAFQLEAPATPGRIPVWAFPCSLAATDGIHVCLCSCGYLDVSVHRVRSTCPIHSGRSHPKVGFPHSEISGSTLVCQLPGAYRRLQRPSSPLDAKTSTIHP
jgi:hypothetical protein